MRDHRLMPVAAEAIEVAEHDRIERTRLRVAHHSPELGAIVEEQLRAARRRTVEELWTTVAACLPLFSATECRNYFRHCGSGESCGSLTRTAVIRSSMAIGRFACARAITVESSTAAAIMS
jgi:hypothetical protein